MVALLPARERDVRLSLKKQTYGAHIGTARLVHAHHDTRRLDDGASRFALFELEIVHRLIGDRGSDNLTADVNPNMGCGGALFHFGDLTFEMIARAEFHENVLSID